MSTNRRQLVSSLLAPVRPAHDHVVDLGGCRVRLVTDDRGSSLLERFCDWHPTEPGEVTDAELWCLASPPPGWSEEDLWLATDTTTRARHFAAGYYATDHFGPPMALVSDGHRHVVVGPERATVTWSYFVKLFLLHHAAEQGKVFIKAAVVAHRDRAVVIVGRGGAGKTTFATGLADAGAAFVANSHALVTASTVRGVATAMRVRSSGFAVDVRTAAPERHVDPRTRFGAGAGGSLPLPIAAICVVRHSGRHRRRIVPIGEHVAIPHLKQLALGLNVYRLEEDLLDAVGDDAQRFADEHNRMSDVLVALARSTPCYLVDVDVEVPGVAAEVLARLGQGGALATP